MLSFAWSQCFQHTTICLLQHDFSVLGADARFQNTGLERSGPLDQDIQDLTQQYSLQKPDVSVDGPGASYAK